MRLKKRTEVEEIHQHSFIELEKLIIQSKQQVWHKMNYEQIFLYWYVGKYVSAKLTSAQWGQSVVDTCSFFLKKRNPQLKGFDRRAIYRMVQFYDTYSIPEFVAALQPQIAEDKEQQFVAALQPQYNSVSSESTDNIFIDFLAQLSWSAHLEILSGCSTLKERVFYMLLSIKEKLNYRELGRQIKTGVYERTLSGNQKLSTKLKETHPQIINILKDRYMIDYLHLHDAHTENDIKKGLLAKMKNFILDLGKDFLFVDQEYRLQVGLSDFYVDLLFYHRSLRCFVAIELKAKKFIPEYLGKLEFYLEALDRDVRYKDENPSIGILLCKTTDDEVVEYALSRSLSPTMIAKYQQGLIPKDVLKSYLKEIE